MSNKAYKKGYSHDLVGNVAGKNIKHLRRKQCKHNNIYKNAYFSLNFCFVHGSSLLLLNYSRAKLLLSRKRAAIIAALPLSLFDTFFPLVAYICTAFAAASFHNGSAHAFEQPSCALFACCVIDRPAGINSHRARSFH